MDNQARRASWRQPIMVAAVGEYYELTLSLVGLTLLLACCRMQSARSSCLSGLQLDRLEEIQGGSAFGSPGSSCSRPSKAPEQLVECKCWQEEPILMPELPRSRRSSVADVANGQRRVYIETRLCFIPPTSSAVARQGISSDNPQIPLIEQPLDSERTCSPCMPLISSFSSSFTARCCLMVERPLKDPCDIEMA